MSSNLLSPPNTSANASLMGQVQERLSFLQFSQEDRKALKSLQPYVFQHIDSILDNFYAHLMRFGNLAQLIGSSANIPRLKEAQKRHWENMFRAEFDADYVMSVMRV